MNEIEWRRHQFRDAIERLINAGAYAFEKDIAKDLDFKGRAGDVYLSLLKKGNRRITTDHLIKMNKLLQKHGLAIIEFMPTDKKIAYIPFIEDMVLTGGDVEGFEDGAHSAVKVPVEEKFKGSFMMRMKGESMEPRLHKDSIIICREITPDEIQYKKKGTEGGSPYVVIKGSNRYVKYIRKDRPGHIILESHNPAFEDLDPIRLEDVKIFRILSTRQDLI